MSWLLDILEATDWHYTPLEILDTEDRYPGLWDDLNTELWQRRLIKGQVDNETKED